MASDARREREETSDGRNPMFTPKYVTQSQRTLVVEEAVTRDGVYIKHANGECGCALFEQRYKTRQVIERTEHK